MPPTQDFFLIINGQPGAYTVEARGPEEISVPPLPFALALDVSLAQALDHIQSGAAPSRLQMIEIGSALFDALFPRRIARAFASLPPEANLRIKLVIRPPELGNLPWELLYDPDHEIFLAARLTTPLVRYVEGSKPAASLLARRPLKVLYLHAAPLDLPPLDLQASEMALRQALGESAEITAVRETTPGALREVLRQPFHILHYDGHAGFDADRQQGVLGLQGTQGMAHFLPADMLATYLDGSSIRLVVLAACESGMDSTRKRFSGLAQQVMRTSRLPAAVAMQVSIPDNLAIAFHRAFYTALTDEAPVDAAVVEGRKAILEVLGNDPLSAPDWATPVLFMRTADGDILRREEPQAATDQPGATLADRPSVTGRQTTLNIGNIQTQGGTVNISAGDIYQTTTTFTAPGGHTNLAGLLRQLQALLPVAGLDPESHQIIIADLQIAVEQAARSQPNQAILLSKLTAIDHLLQSSPNLAAARAALSPLLQAALETARSRSGS
jgi:hypothetical protein